MLLLARRAGEAVLIEGGIRITVVAVEGRTVRLGIEAPADQLILRAEIADELAERTTEAVASRDAAARAGFLPAPQPEPGPSGEAPTRPGRPTGRRRKQ